MILASFGLGALTLKNEHNCTTQGPCYDGKSQAKEIEILTDLHCNSNKLKTEMLKGMCE